MKKYNVFPAKKEAPYEACGPYSHGSTLTELPTGEILVMWYAGSGEKKKDVGIWMAKFDPKTEKWSQIEEVEKESTKTSEGNPVIYYDSPTERLWLFWATMDRAEYKRLAGGWSTCRLKCKHSDDLGKTWSATRYLTKTWGRMTRNKPIRLSNGDFLLPIYSEWLGYKGNFFISTAEEFASGAVSSKWIKIGPITGGVMQPTVIELEPGHLLAYMRTAKTGTWGGSISKAESFDYGRKWTRVEKAPLPNPNAGSDMVKLQNGHIALAFNNSSTARNPLSVGLSLDGGKTWPHIQNIEFDPAEKSKGRYSYPGIIQTKSGYIYCTYSNKEGHNIRCARFEENWILTGK